MSVRILSAAALLASAATSQLNPFVFYPQDPERQTITCTSYVGRPNGNQHAEALMEMSPEHFRGIADGNSMLFYWGAYHWIADENLSTVETYDIVWRVPDSTGAAPDMSNLGEYARIAGLTTPPSTSTARGTWITYEGFWHPNPVALPIWADHLYVGVDLPANPAWPATDGHSLFRADLLSANTPATLGENERLGAPNPTWGGVAGGTPYSTPWTYILGPLVTTPSLHVGGIDPLSGRLGAAGANLGMNGLYPDVTGTPRCDGLMFRVTDSLAPNALVLAGANYSFQFRWNWHIPGLNPPIIGGSYIGLPGVAIPLGTHQLHTGSVDIPVALPNTIPNTMVGSEIVFQAVVFDTTGLHAPNWTNAQIVHF